MHNRKTSKKRPQHNDSMIFFVHFSIIIIYEKGDRQESINPFRIDFKFCSRGHTYGVCNLLVFWIWFQ